MLAALAEEPVRAATPQPPLLDVRDLRVVLADGTDIVSDIAFSLAPGEIVGLVGESGSGKTTIATALLGDSRPGARIAGGSVLIEGEDLLRLPPAALRAARGTLVAHVAQDPAMALNPALRIGAHLDEMLRFHAPGLIAAERQARIAAVARDVGLPDDAAFLRRFPHQLSGGQQQRVLLALGFILNPRVIVLDEPTTALDVTTQARILATIRRLCRDHGTAAVYVSHDLAVVRSLVDRVVVLYAGRIAEVAPRELLFATPLHPYSQGLLASIPDIAERRVLHGIPGQAPAPSQRPEGCAFAPRCRHASDRCRVMPARVNAGAGRLLACHHPVEAPLAPAPAGSIDTVRTETSPPLLTVHGAAAAYGSNRILFDIDLDLPRGRCTALVGESGSGKTTLARAIVGLGQNATGRMTIDGTTLDLARIDRNRELRRRIQYIFQNPYRALNPRQTVGATLTAAVRHFFPVNRADAVERAAAALARVALSREVLAHYPRDLSGGERQRVAIARALICEPELLICDEITSALDASMQAAILDLLSSLQREGLTLLFVTHDLAVVRAIADRVVVLRAGRIVEKGLVADVLDAPADGYTRALVADSPRLDLMPAAEQLPA